MFGIGGFEFFLILIFGFLIVGPDRLPAMAKTLGKAISKFRGAQEEMNKVIKTEVYDPESKDPFKNPLEALEKAAGSSKGASSSKASESKPASGAGSSATGERRESFSERKARYEKERAAKKAADAEKEAAEKRAANAAKDAVPAKNAASQPAKDDAVEPAKADAAQSATEEKGE